MTAARDLKLTRLFDILLQAVQRFFHHRPKFPVVDKNSQLFPGIPAEMEVEPPLNGQAVRIHRQELKPSRKTLAIREVPGQPDAVGVRSPLHDPELIRAHERARSRR